MARATKNVGPAGAKGFRLFDGAETRASETEEDELPKDEAGRSKIKQQYIDLLGIRMRKLKGRVLNRERINKTLEGVYFVCGRCERVCHNLDDGLVEDEENKNNLCKDCHTALTNPPKAVKSAKSSHRKTAKKATAKKK